MVKSCHKGNESPLEQYALNMVICPIVKKTNDRLHDFPHRRQYTPASQTLATHKKENPEKQHRLNQRVRNLAGGN